MSYQRTRCAFHSSQKASLFPQKHEWALLSRRRVSERRFSESASVPELEPLEVVGSHLDVVLVTMMLEEKLLVAPERWGGLRTGDEPADVAFWAFVITVLRWAVVAENSEHDGVFWHNLELVLEVVLESVGPAIDIIRLDIDLERPVRVLLLVAVLIELSQLHDGHGTGVIADLVQVLANGLPGAVVIHLLEDVGPTILEEVEGRLSIEGEHGEPIG